MEKLNSMTENEVNKLNKNSLLSLVKSIRRDSDTSNATQATASIEAGKNDAEPLTLRAIEQLFNSKLNELSAVFAARIELVEQENANLKHEINSLKKLLSTRDTAPVKDSEFETLAHKVNSPKFVSSSSNELIIFGIAEQKASSPSHRFDMLHKDVTRCIEALGENTEDCVIDFHRVGKFQENKGRPIIIRVKSIWSKRKLLVEFNKQKANGSANFVLKQRLTDSVEFRAARQRAKSLNDQERAKASAAGLPLHVSFSPRPNGSVVKFTFTDNKWLKDESSA